MGLAVEGFDREREGGYGFDVGVVEGLDESLEHLLFGPFPGDAGLDVDGVSDALFGDVGEQDTAVHAAAGENRGRWVHDVWRPLVSARYVA